MKKSTIVLILRVALGALFILSGIAKLDSIYQFEQDIFKAGVTNWDIIPYLSRFTIAFEILLGICFFHHEGLKRFSIPATFAMLVIFTIHLSYTVITAGGFEGNCGCFGNKIPMTPFSSLIKNIVMLGALVYLYKTPIQKPAREVFIPISLGALSFVFVFVFFPVKSYVTNASVDEVASIKTTNTSTEEVPVESKDSLTKVDAKISIDPKKEVPAKIDKNNPVIKKSEPDPVKPKLAVDTKIAEPKPARVTSKYAPFKNFSNGITTDLDEGKKIVCMYNTGCDHCMDNAKKMVELSKKGGLPPVYILFWGNEAEIPAFFDFAKGNFPYKLLEPQVFFPLLGKGNFPRVSYLHEGNIIGEWEGDDFSSEKLTEALKK